MEIVYFYATIFTLQLKWTIFFYSYALFWRKYDTIKNSWINVDETLQFYTNINDIYIFSIIEKIAEISMSKPML